MISLGFFFDVLHSYFNPSLTLRVLECYMRLLRSIERFVLTTWTTCMPGL
jgi:hypothetical protein